MFNARVSRGWKAGGALLAVLLTFALVLAVAPSASAAPKVIKIGAIEPLSGPIATIGKNNVNGYKLAVEQINAAGGIKSLGGAKLELIVADSEGKQQVGMSQTEKLIEQGVVAILGAYQSSVTFVTTQVAERQGTPFVVGVSVADAITKRGFRYTFRVCETGSMLINQVYEFITAMGKQTGKPAATAAVLYEDTLFGQAISKGQKALGPLHNIKIVESVAYPHATSTVAPQLLKLKAAEPDILFAISYLSDAVLISRTIMEQGFNVMGLFGTGGYDQLAYEKTAGKAAEYVFNVGIWSAKTKIKAAQQLAVDYQNRFKEPITGMSGISYAAVSVIKEALEQAGTTDKAKLRDALAKVDLAAGEKGNVMHYRIAFDETGQNIHGIKLIEQVLKGEKMPVWPAEYAPVKPVWPVPKWSERK